MSLPRKLTNQAELIYQLDPEPVFDYLLQHRALQQSDIDQIKNAEKLSDRNSKLLQHLEELGNPAIELFINALRQSGQMHLASSLDVEHRIKPVSGSGYWEKQRYKGQVAISFQLVAAKVLVRKDSDEDTSPRIVDINAMLTPFKVKHSYENMTLIGVNESGPKARKILEYSYEEEEEEQGCCWCCLPFWCCCTARARRQKGKHQKQELQKSVELSECRHNGAEETDRKSESSLNMYDIMVSLPSQPSSPIKSGSTFFKTRKLSPTVDVMETELMLIPKSDSVDRNSNHQLNEVLRKSISDEKNGDGDNVKMTSGDIQKDVEASAKSKSKNGKKSQKSIKDSNNDVEKNNQVNGKLSPNIENKENSDPSIYGMKQNGVNKKEKKKNGEQKASPPNTLNTKSGPSPTTGMKRSETYELVERWKSEGRAYQNARDHFFSYFDNSIQSRIVRYFEQERSTLVLQVGLKEGMSVCTICMTTIQVKKLREDYEMGVLHEDLVRCVQPQDVIDKMECCAIHLRTVIDDNDFALSYQELA